MKTNLRAQEIIVIAICTGPLHVLLETLVFTFWEEVNRGEKKIPILVQALFLQSNDCHKIKAMNCR